MEAVHIGHGPWRVRIGAEVPEALITSGQWLTWSKPLPRSGTSTDAVAVGVEVRRVSGGIRPVALLGGRFTPGTELLTLAVAATGELTLGVTPRIPSDLGGPLVAGLPDEFADPVLTAVSAVLSQWDHGPGTLAIGSAGCDEVHSSTLAFRLAGQLLATAVGTQREGAPVNEAMVMQIMAAW